MYLTYQQNYIQVCIQIFLCDLYRIKTLNQEDIMDKHQIIQIIGHTTTPSNNLTTVFESGNPRIMDTAGCHMCPWAS